MAFYWRPYVPVAQRRANALRKMEKLRKKGQNIQPVEIEGKTIARSFWGKAWCEHLESFSDFENRLPRGRTYVRNGSVCHLAIEPGRIEAMVSGSELYKVKINIKPLKPAVWKAIKKQCRGQIGSMLELLQGRLSDQVMAIVTNRNKGLLPLPGQIALGCNCPDWAGMCKHLAAVLYGVGNRLDRQPELLFTLRGVDANELITGDISLPDTAAATGKTIADDQLADIFGVDLDTVVSKQPPTRIPARKKQTTVKGNDTKKQTGIPSSHKRKITVAKKKVVKSKVASRKKTPEKHDVIRSNTDLIKLPQIRPTGKSVARLRNQLKLSVPEFAKRLEVTAASIYRWEKSSGRLKLQPHIYKAFAQLHQQVRK